MVEQFAPAFLSPQSLDSFLDSMESLVLHLNSIDCGLLGLLHHGLPVFIQLPCCTTLKRSPVLLLLKCIHMAAQYCPATPQVYTCALPALSLNSPSEFCLDVTLCLGPGSKERCCMIFIIIIFFIVMECQ